MLNRSSVIVRPKQPYLDWISEIDELGILPEAGDECTVYLIPEYEDNLQKMEIMSVCFEAIFEVELSGWNRDEDTWPQNRTFEMFCEWFSLEFNLMVTDLCDYEIKEDGYA